MKTKIITVLAVLFTITFQAQAAYVLTFDDIGEVDESTLIPDGYGGFDWDYFYYLNSSVPSQTNGLNNGLVSGDYLAHNSGYFNLVGLSGTSFTFQGTWLTAVWRDGLNIQVEGYLEDEVIYSTTVVVDTTGPTWFDFDYIDIDNLEFSSSGGTAHEGYSHDGYHFTMDDFTYIPEPTTLLLFTFGAVLLRRQHS